jgi:hypothetical protein
MENTNCSKCGAEVRIVPPGISKKSGKPYGSFYACKSCQNTENIGNQPPRQTPRQSNKTAPQSFEDPQLKEIIRLLEILVSHANTAKAEEELIIPWTTNTFWNLLEKLTYQPQLI